MIRQYIMQYYYDILSYHISILLSYCHTIILLRFWVIILLYYYTIVLLYHYFVILPYSYITIWLYLYIIALRYYNFEIIMLSNNNDSMIFEYSSIILSYPYNIIIFRCCSIPILWYSSTVMLDYHDRITLGCYTTPSL